MWRKYETEYGDKPLGEFVREIVGLDMTAAIARKRWSSLPRASSILSRWSDMLRKEGDALRPFIHTRKKHFALNCFLFFHEKNTISLTGWSVFPRHFPKLFPYAPSRLWFDCIIAYPIGKCNGEGNVLKVHFQLLNQNLNCFFANNGLSLLSKIT